MVMAGFFGIVGLWPLLEPAEPRWWSLAIAAAFLVLAALVPRSLTPLNRLWTAFGLLLHKITNPLFLGVIYFLAVVPTGLVLRALGKDLLRTRFDKSAASYWIKREPPGPPPATMTRQF
jgi:hypothetical protein